MKKYKIIYEVKDIEYSSHSKLIRILKDPTGKRYKISIDIPVNTTGSSTGHFWNGDEWAFVCGRFDINNVSISPYDDKVKKERLMLEVYDKILNFIDCLED